MRFKLDENFGTRTQQLFKAAGHEVQTVRDQHMQGCSDRSLYETCCSEKYCLVTLDLDFADIIDFPPAKASGIIVIRVSRNPSLALLEKLVRQFLEAIVQTSVEGRLWIVEPGHIRVHRSETSDNQE